MACIDEIDDMDLSDKYVALFGTETQEAFADTFVDAIDILYRKVESSKAKIIDLQ